ncbi:hypothetical protein AB0F17_61785 [Nonomuraea sp. NPDC026600]|uniref:hypothetical protein n=1 Tax=Nonomuraea sp. NPDC026600 TaxID=3155363 RepID=UPI0033F21BE6
MRAAPYVTPRQPVPAVTLRQMRACLASDPTLYGGGVKNEQALAFLAQEATDVRNGSIDLQRGVHTLVRLSAGQLDAIDADRMLRYAAHLPDIRPGDVTVQPTLDVVERFLNVSF